MFTTRTRLSMFVIVIGYTILVRLLPYFLHGAGIDLQASFLAYAWNFSPVFALSLFGNAQLQSRCSERFGTILFSPLVVHAVEPRLIQIRTSKVEAR